MLLPFVLTLKVVIFLVYSVCKLVYFVLESIPSKHSIHKYDNSYLNIPVVHKCYFQILRCFFQNLYPTRVKVNDEHFSKKIICLPQM